MSLIATPGNRKRMRIIVALAFFSQWSGNGLVSYYLNKVFNQIGITGSSTQLLINGLLQVWNLFWAVLAAFMVNRLGRRFLFLTSAGLMTLFYMVQTICFAQYSKHGIPATGYAVVGFVFLFFAAYDIAFTPLIVSYTVEILPFHLRAKGFNIFGFIISLAGIFNQYVNPIALSALGWKYYVSLLSRYPRAIINSNL
jgi:MFS family permease